jgi:hypothetical protein
MHPPERMPVYVWPKKQRAQELQETRANGPLHPRQLKILHQKNSCSNTPASSRAIIAKMERMEDEAVASVDVAATDDAPSVEVFSNSKEETPRYCSPPHSFKFSFSFKF